MAVITEPQGGWQQYSNIFEFYEGAGDLPVHHSFEFDVSLEPNEFIVSKGIQASVALETYGGSRQGMSVVSKFVDYFERNGAIITLKYRDRKTLEIKTVNGFNNLPDPKTCDVIEFTPPNELTAQIIYTPIATIRTIDPANPTAPPVISTVRANFTQTLHGTYQGYANKLVDYINKSGPFPRI
ncbi:hypothetical protein phiAS5_ORF0334 [Aeromonas phage phiAS5]|uniref:Uncharacterized protein n=1 Tax=Aeromonas phage phiAS5 TaxID=879630 RepID=E1A288_9CAUD|nr:hypothetical protein phiAS5_ORF0334 [Aeromonas phage phiAS5]ADM80177.1 hypothetical protein phiAS5_ORF0334 [Aeromonas phage phiAS5]BES53060.1 hypothetical protein [Aeromonas phage phiWae14]